MNFQSLSVGQKLATSGNLDPVVRPSVDLANAIGFVDRWSARCKSGAWWHRR
jgi:hypothetical protein